MLIHLHSLEHPVGALTATNREAAQVRFENLIQVDEVPFHYGLLFHSCFRFPDSDWCLGQERIFPVR